MREWRKRRGPLYTSFLRIYAHGAGDQLRARPGRSLMSMNACWLLKLWWRDRAYGGRRIDTLRQWKAETQSQTRCLQPL